jgi:excisionase family DNA binding protein
MMRVHEIAEYLRVKDRKVYDSIALKQIPCTRVMGKWLFPRRLIDLWLMQNSEAVVP